MLTAAEIALDFINNRSDILPNYKLNLIHNNTNVSLLPSLTAPVVVHVEGPHKTYFVNSQITQTIVPTSSQSQLFPFGKKINSSVLNAHLLAVSSGKYSSHLEVNLLAVVYKMSETHGHTITHSM